ncbi:histidine phosphatase family protein [Chitinophaga sp. MM2321]|uniref:histidine phosphatase family protein n=1 Tax=Chitinophaga sp. MM2321 TaxID=3137178 RepID=UPI0032D58DD0
MINVFLLRHGETAWNADNNRYCGRTDIPLTPKGISQAEAVREQLKQVQIDGVYASPLQRAWTTAQIATGKEVIKDDRLIEADFGNWEHKTREEFIAENEKLWLDWKRDPAVARAGGTGENATEIITRVDDFFMGLVRKHQSGTFLVAAHNGVNRFYLAHKLGMPLKNYQQLTQDNSSITLFTLDETGGFVLKQLNSKM